MIDKIEVTGKDALEYLNYQLSMGKTLSKLIANIALEKGKVFAFIPTETSIEYLYNFDKGGIYPPIKSELNTENPLQVVRNDARGRILNIIFKQLKSHKDNCCIFEEPHSVPSDPIIEKLELKYVHLFDEMYYLLNQGNERENVEKTFKKSEGFYFLCLLTNLETDRYYRLILDSEITESNLAELVENMSSFIVKAYDGEGYLVWEKVSD